MKFSGIRETDAMRAIGGRFFFGFITVRPPAVS